MALTKAHNRMIEGAPINVRDYGAKGDGVTDDTAAIQAAIDFVYASAVDTGTSYSLTQVIAQPAWNGTIGKVHVPNGKYKINSKVTLKTGVHLYGDNAMLLMTAGYLELSNIWTGLHNLNLVTDGTTSTAIIVEDTEVTRRNDVPIVELNAIKFKNFADCFKCGTSIVNGFSLMKFRDLHTENCTQFSSKLFSDRAEFTSCSFRVPFDTTDIAFIYNNSTVSFEGCTFAPWPEVTSGTNIQNARYVDNYGTFVSFHNCRLGNEDINAGNNAVTTYRAAKNVSAVYNYTGVPALSNNGADYYENANVSIISLTDNLLFQRNSSAIVLFDVPNKIVIKGNVGTSGAIFDANFDVQTADYLIRVDSGITYPTPSELRRLISIDIDQPSSFMHLFDTGSDFSNPLFECVRLDGVTRLYQPDSVSGTTATFTLDVSHLPAAHTGRIKVYGQPRAGSNAVAILDFEYSSRMYYDTTGLTDNKQLAAKTPLHTIRADEGGSIVHNSPGIASLVWGGSGSPTTTWLDRDDLRLVVTNMGVSGDKNSCYAVLEAYPTNGVLYL